MVSLARVRLDVILRPFGKLSFINSLPKNSRILDVGCGSNSPEWAKTARPDCYYVGLDIGDYAQTESSKAAADEYVYSTPEAFAGAVESMQDFDAVISSHNLEHCNEPQRVLRAMAHSLRSGGRMYLSFPCEASTAFPPRAGCLNFFDDATHTQPPEWRAVLEALTDAGMKITHQEQRSRPPIPAAIGLALEPALGDEDLTAPRGRSVRRAYRRA
jgi:SAM-dependent methyltransferase